MVDFIGRDGNVVLFSNGSDAVAINTDLNLVVGVGEHAVLASARNWEQTDETPSDSLIELASGAVTTLDINVITASARMYTIPDGAKAEAKKALEWRKEHKRGGTPVGLNTARTLAKGGQIGIEKIRHIAKYFPRHEVDKKGKGWKPGEDSFPSNGRIAWALWGGDAAWRWARAIVERENKKSVTAGGYALPGYHDSVDTYKTAGDYDSNVKAFKDAYELEENYGPEFMARVCMDGSGVDRLYKIDINGKVCVWDDGVWDDLGHVDGDIWLYDNALDDPYDHVQKDHFLIDPESAVYISAMLQANPHGKVRIEDMDPDEANLVAMGLMDEDLQMLDYALVAAGDSMSGSKPKGAVKSGDGQYTGAERSAIASQAPRDATGKFAKAGGRAVIGNDAAKGAGTIIGRSKTPGNIQFKLDATGKTIDIPAKFSTPEDKFVAPQAPKVDFGKPLNVEGILGEPRTPQSMPNAQLPGTLPPMDPAGLKSVLNDWDGYVAEQRASFKPLTDKQVRQYAKDTNQKVREVGSETRTPLPGQKNGPTGNVTTVKDGKLVTQSGPAPRSSGSTGKSAPTAPAAPAGPVAQAQGTGKAKAFKPAVTTDSKDGGEKPVVPPRPFNDGKMDSKTTSKLLAPLNKKSSGTSGAKLVAPLSGKSPTQKIFKDVPVEKRLYTGSKAQDALRDDRNADRKKGREADAQDRLRDVKNAERKSGASSVKPKAGGKGGSGSGKASTGGTFTKDGQYVIQKGDNLWALAEKYKPKGETTASYWNKVMKANPKGNFKSGNPSLIYSGEKVNLPGVTGPAAPSKPKYGDDNRDSLKPRPATPGKPSSDERRDSLKPKTGKPSSDERRDSLKPKDKPAAKPSSDERRDSLKPRPKPDAKPSSDERRDSLKPKTGKPSSDERRDNLRPEQKPFLDKPVESGVPKSLQKPKGPATPRQADGPAKRTTSDPKDKGMAPGKPAAKPFLDKPVNSGVPKSLQKPKGPATPRQADGPAKRTTSDPKDKGIAPGKPKPNLTPGTKVGPSTLPSNQPQKQPGGSRVVSNKPSIPDSIIKRGKSGTKKRK